MSDGISVIVLAAGKGTRMKSKLSKLLHKIGNLELLGHVLMTVKELEPQEISLVVSEENQEEIRKRLETANWLKNGGTTDLKMVIQWKRNGTGAAAKVGLKGIENTDNKILLLYGDVPFIRASTYQNMVKKMENSKSDLLLLGFRTKNTDSAYGRLIMDKNNKIERIVEYRDATPEERAEDRCNAGIYLIKNAKLLAELLKNIDNKNSSGEYYLTDIIHMAVARGLSCDFILAEEEEVRGINSQEELASAEASFQNRKRLEFMDAGVTLMDPSSVFFSYDSALEANVLIEPNVYFDPGVSVKSGARIRAFSYLESCSIGENVVVGPFAHIRPGTLLKNSSRVGNFCEIKNSTVGANTKVNHLTYLGDAEVGDNTNIGAGVITCNYDGYGKFKTQIGNDAFIGSNVTLVAPLKLGNDVLVGAASVLTNNVEDGSLALARAEQKNFSGAMERHRLKRENKKRQ